jgi:hypothetical protein
MHFLRLLLATWLEIGIVTVFFLFWLCKRTVSRINTLDKPVLDQDTFQQLLAAAYTLQEQNRLPVNETKADSSQAVSLRPKSLPMTQSEVEPLASLNASAVPSSRDKRIPRSDEFFWRVATAVAMAALFALLLVTSHHRLSALPARLEVVQQEPIHGSINALGKVILKPGAIQTTDPFVAAVFAGQKHYRAVLRKELDHVFGTIEIDVIPVGPVQTTDGIDILKFANTLFNGR